MATEGEGLMQVSDFSTKETQEDTNPLSAYRMEKCTAKGQLSEVYRATHLATGLSVAIKRMRINDMHPTMQKECQTEVQFLQSLDHPHLIQYHEHFIHEDDLYIVMELATGGTLAERVETVRRAETRIEEGLLWRWLYDVASGLAYLHKNRVLHRDVKPAHIFVGESGQAKLGDFGLSKEMSAKTLQAFSCVGTPFYMSPEIVKNEGYSFASDVWSLGCSMYELAEGFPPFYRQDMNFKALGDAICSARYRPLSPEVWSIEFIDLVQQILAVNPAQRPDAQRILDVAGCRSRVQEFKRIQDFDVLGTIGRGKFSEVYRSLWKTSGKREVALKRIQIFEMDTEARQQCNAEVDMLKRLDHHTIIKYLDSFVESSELVIVLELATHGDLANLCRNLKHDKRVLAEGQIWAIFYQVCDALHYMHSNRIMHRDIKPANIFMCNHGVVKLGDLGLGRYFSSNTYRAHSVVGTPFYMSPEVITNSDGYSFKSDIWSLGCVLYELATLSSPFESSRLNYYTLGRMICNAEYTPLPDGTSGRVCELCRSMIRVKRDVRPDAASVFTASRRHFVLCTQLAPDGEDQRRDNKFLLKSAADVVRELVEPAAASEALPSYSSIPEQPPAPHSAVASQLLHSDFVTTDRRGADLAVSMPVAPRGTSRERLARRNPAAVPPNRTSNEAPAPIVLPPKESHPTPPTPSAPHAARPAEMLASSLQLATVREAPRATTRQRISQSYSARGTSHDPVRTRAGPPGGSGSRRRARTPPAYTPPIRPALTGLGPLRVAGGTMSTGVALADGWKPAVVQAGSLPPIQRPRDLLPAFPAERPGVGRTAAEPVVAVPEAPADRTRTTRPQALQLEPSAAASGSAGPPLRPAAPQGLGSGPGAAGHSHTLGASFGQSGKPTAVGAVGNATSTSPAAALGTAAASSGFAVGSGRLHGGTTMRGP